MGNSDRRPNRGKRGSTRNESCGEGGNESPRKPKFRKKEEITPIRKPRLTVPSPKVKEPRDPSPVGVREAKPDGMSLNLTLDCLEEFNGLVTHMAEAGLEVVKKAGDFSEVQKNQQVILDKIRTVAKEHLSPEMLATFSRLENATRSSKYVRKEKMKDGTWKYFY